MPSTQLFTQSGGIALVSGDLYSGSPVPAGSLYLRLSTSGAGPVFVGLPDPTFISGVVTGQSGGSLSSGGRFDGMEMVPGSTYTIPAVRLVSGVFTPRVIVPAASSGSRLFWETF